MTSVSRPQRINDQSIKLMRHVHLDCLNWLNCLTKLFSKYFWTKLVSFFFPLKWPAKLCVLQSHSFLLKIFPQLSFVICDCDLIQTRQSFSFSNGSVSTVWIERFSTEVFMLTRICCLYHGIWCMVFKTLEKSSLIVL